MGRGGPELPESIDEAREVLSDEEFFVPRSELPAEPDQRKAYVRRLHMRLAKTARRFQHTKEVLDGERPPDSEPDIPENLWEAEAYLEGNSFFRRAGDLPDEASIIGEYIEQLHLQAARGLQSLRHGQQRLREREQGSASAAAAGGVGRPDGGDDVDSPDGDHQQSEPTEPGPDEGETEPRREEPGENDAGDQADPSPQSGNEPGEADDAETETEAADATEKSGEEQSRAESGDDIREESPAERDDIREESPAERDDIREEADAGETDTQQGAEESSGTGADESDGAGGFVFGQRDDSETGETTTDDSTAEPDDGEYRSAATRTDEEGPDTSEPDDGTAPESGAIEDPESQDTNEPAGEDHTETTPTDETDRVAGSDSRERDHTETSEDDRREHAETSEDDRRERAETSEDDRREHAERGESDGPEHAETSEASRDSGGEESERTASAGAGGETAADATDEKDGLARRTVVAGGGVVALVTAIGGGGLATFLLTRDEGDETGNGDPQEATGDDTAQNTNGEENPGGDDSGADDQTGDGSGGGGNGGDDGGTANGGDDGGTANGGSDGSSGTGNFELADFEVAVEPANEYVELEYTGEGEQDISGYALYDSEGGQAHPSEPGTLDPFTIPEGTVLSQGESIRVYTGEGSGSEGVFYWGYGVNIWNQSGDTVIVENASGSVVFETRYTSEN
jgi:hypothetical protein